LLFAIPIGFMLIIHETIISALIGALAAIWLVSILHNGCMKCPNFSCLFNRVSKSTVDEYLRRNPTMRDAWEKAGYTLDESPNIPKKK